MLILSNGFSKEIFSCHEELIDFLGQEDFNAVMEGNHSQYSMCFLPIT